MELSYKSSDSMELVEESPLLTAVEDSMDPDNPSLAYGPSRTLEELRDALDQLARLREQQLGAEDEVREALELIAERLSLLLPQVDGEFVIDRQAVTQRFQEQVWETDHFRLQDLAAYSWQVLAWADLLSNPDTLNEGFCCMMAKLMAHPSIDSEKLWEDQHFQSMVNQLELERSAKKLVTALNAMYLELLVVEELYTPCNAQLDHSLGKFLRLEKAYLRFAEGLMNTVLMAQHGGTQRLTLGPFPWASFPWATQGAGLLRV
jgi:hypothetical protein